MSVIRLTPTLIIALLAAGITLWLYFATGATDEPYANSRPPADRPRQAATADQRAGVSGPCGSAAHSRPTTLPSGARTSCFAK
jgi:hypothetical protein